MSQVLKLKLDNLELGTVWLGFSKSKPIIEDGYRLENLSWRLWQRELRSSHHNQYKSSTKTLTLLINSIIQPKPSSNNNNNNNSSSNNNNQLQLPPTIINIAPTPPTASPAITAPTSPISQPYPLITPNPAQQPHHLLLSPYPTQPDQQQLTYFDQRPSLDQRHSSGSTTSSSLALKSIATSPSIQAPLDNHLNIQEKQINNNKQTADRQKNSNNPHRRANSTAGFKHKRRPLSAPRVHSHQSTSRSVSPRLVQLSKLQSPSPPPIQDQQQRNSHWLNDNNNSPRSSSPSSSHEHFQDFSKPLDLTDLTDLTPSTQNLATETYEQPKHQLSPDPDSQTTLSAGYTSSASLPSLLSPIIPETPNNSQVSAPFQVAQTGIPDSLASSNTTARSSAFMPSAPPPTPSQNGVPLPTTMSVGLKNKSKLIHHPRPPSLPPINTSSTAAPKKKAKFFIKEYEPDDDHKTFSPTSLPPVTQIAQGFTETTIPTTSPPAIPGEPGSAEKQQKKMVQLTVEEEEEGSDSDEWGSEYSDDETKEDESRALQQELEKKRKQEEYHRQLFAKKHFYQRNRSHDGTEDQPAPIRRAGLSMLFHPELNHLQHHPTSSSGARQPGETPGGPIRNQSAVELRRAGSSSSRKPVEGEGHSRASIGPIARPCSLIKSKSSVAVPVLAGQEPPVMVQRSPSSISGNSSLRNRPPTRRNSAAPTAGPSTTTSTQPPTRSLPHPAHQRHPSRLAGKPENVEYSDDSDSECEEGDKGGREEQERRLARRTGTHTEPIVLGTGGLSALANRPSTVAEPLSPRTTRRNMLANEMSESVRRNLLWERQSQPLALGVVPARHDLGPTDPAPLAAYNPAPHPSFSRQQPTNNQLTNTVTTATTSTSSTTTAIDPSALPNSNTTSTNPTVTNTQFKKTQLASLTNSNKEYRNFSKGFHRTGW